MGEKVYETMEGGERIGYLESPVPEPHPPRGTYDTIGRGEAANGGKGRSNGGTRRVIKVATQTHLGWCCWALYV